MNKVITSLNITDNVALVTLSNIPNEIKIISEIFTAIAKENINVDMISQTAPYNSIVNISFTIDEKDVGKLINRLGKFKKKIKELRIDFNCNNTKISIFGEAMRYTPGIAAETLEVLKDYNINIKLITTSEVDISYLIYSLDKERAIKAFTEKYNLYTKK